MTTSSPSPDLIAVDRKGLAVYLWLRGFRPDFITVDGRKGTWHFRFSEDLDHHVKMFSDRKTLVEPNEYFLALIQLNLWSREERNVRK